MIVSMSRAFGAHLLVGNRFRRGYWLAALRA
jgi:hypothetical protein